MNPYYVSVKKSVYLLILVSILTVLPDFGQVAERYPIIPKPARLEARPGEFAVRQTTLIQVPLARITRELQSYFIRRIDRFISAKGRTIIGWDEIIQGTVSPGATIMCWRGTRGH